MMRMVTAAKTDSEHQCAVWGEHRVSRFSRNGSYS
jgi:hypothetical protein